MCAREQICKQLGGTIDDSELVNGMVFEKGAQKSAGGPTRIENAKVSFIVAPLTFLFPLVAVNFDSIPCDCV